MRRTALGSLAVVLCLAGLCARVGATPSTTYWTPCTADIQAFGKFHVTYDNYFSAFDRPGHRGNFPADYGLTVGILPWEKLQAEIGFDVFKPGRSLYFFNAKLGTPEGALWDGSPALAFGIFNLGFKKRVTDQNVWHVDVTKTLPHDLGRLHLGAYIGNSRTLVSSGGHKENKGLMIGWDRWLVKDKVMLAADYATGKNALGGGGVGVYYFFTKDISVLVGPVWFNDRGLNGGPKLTIQWDINF
ncbi:MAG: hypothetical protein FJ291_10525 [Planctomycetes bacterium]|nr:hypothetical protein [Planctomycetota bacterium]